MSRSRFLRPSLRLKMSVRRHNGLSSYAIIPICEVATPGIVLALYPIASSRTSPQWRGDEISNSSDFDKTGLFARRQSLEPSPKEHDLSIKNKIKNEVRQLIGKVKAKIGKVTGNRRLQAQGKSQQARANLKQIAEKAKDVFKV